MTRAQSRIHPQFTYEVVWVDKALAQEWLEHNAQNRNLRTRLVSQYARDMREDRWHNAGDPIRFDWDGNLQDGQHRLTGVVQADVRLPFFVIRGLPPESQQYMDIGAKRNVGDALGFAGFANSKRVGTAARTLFMYETGMRPTHAEIIELTRREEDNDLEDSANMGDKVYRGLRGTQGLYSAAYHLLKQVDMRDANIFFDSLASGTDLSLGSPILTMRNYLIKAGAVSNNPVAVKAGINSFFHTWNYWRKGQKLHILRPKTVNRHETIKPI